MLIKNYIVNLIRSKKKKKIINNLIYFLNKKFIYYKLTKNVNEILYIQRLNI
jgi:hypothetical protein